MDLCTATLADCFLPDGHQRRYNGPLPAESEGLLQMVLGLEYLHSRSVVHGNLKPQNILLSAGQSVTFKLSDAGQRDGILSIWMAPEILKAVQCQSQRQVNANEVRNPSSDVWSLGCLFFYFLQKGSHPFESVNMSETINNIVKGNAAQLKFSSGKITH